MKAITVCQPFAWLITLPENDPRNKRVENREWYTHYRGPILIHAGKSKAYMSKWSDISSSETQALTFGAVIAKARLSGCMDWCEVVRGMGQKVDREQERWLWSHSHTHGPFCWILADVEPLTPIPCRGKQGLWDYDGIV